MWTKCYNQLVEKKPGLSEKRIHHAVKTGISGISKDYRVCANDWATAEIMEAGSALVWITRSSKDVKRDLTDYIQGFNSDVVELFQDLELLPSEHVTSGHIQQLASKSKDIDLLKSFVTEIVKDFDFSNVQPDWMSNLFEDCIRQFNATAAKSSGEHYTPRDGVGLLSELLLNGNQPQGEVNFYDPTCGTGGILFTGKEMLEKRCKERGLKVSIKLYGQELMSFTRGLTKADMLLRGEDFTNIKHGDTLLKDMHEGKKFRYIGANPPYGVNWSGIADEVRAEAAKGDTGRFPAGCPRTTSEGQLLFLQHMVSKMKDPSENATEGGVAKGSRVAVVMNGNPLFAADAGKGDSNIRGWLLRNDLVECIVALPREMFCNTGIATYIWVLTNKKEGKRKGHVQLIDATGMGTRLPKSQGAKRYELTEEAITQISRWHQDKADKDVDKRCKMLPNDAFGYYSVTIEHPEVIEGIPVFKVEGTRPKKDKSGNLVMGKDNNPKREKFFELVSPEDSVKGQSVTELGLEHIEKGTSLNGAVDYLHGKATQACMESETWSEEVKWGKVSVHIVKDTERLPALGAPVSALQGDSVALSGGNLTKLKEWATKEITALRPKDAPDFKILGTKIGWEIPFTQLFYVYQQPEDPFKLAEKIQTMFAGLTLDTSFLPTGVAQ